MRTKRRRPRGGPAPGSGRDCREGFPHTALSDPNQVITAHLSGSRRCTALGGLFTVDAYAPVLALSRLLLRAGIAGDRVLEVYRGSTLCFRVKLATAARLTIENAN